MNGSLIDRTQVKKILVIKLRAIGDVLLSTVVLEHLRKAFREAEICFLTEKGGTEVIESNPFVDKVITFNPKTDNGLRLISKIRKQGFDLVIDLFGNPRSALVTLLSGAVYRAGYRFGWRRYCYNIVIRPRGGEIHNTEFNLDALRALGIAVTGNRPLFIIKKEDQDFANEFFINSGLGSRPVVAINPTGGWYTKRWPGKSYAELADQIIEKYKADILILWGPGEEKYAESIRRLMKKSARLIPASTLKQMGAIISRCALLITNDGGPMHIAAALGAPVAAIFGPTNPNLQGPYGTRSIIIRKPDLSCLGCNLTKCPIDNICMEELSVGDVLEGVGALMNKLQEDRNAT